MTKISEDEDPKKREYQITDFYALFDQQIPEKYVNKLNYFLLGLFAVGILSAIFLRG
jgi:hypothetical protein